MKFEKLIPYFMDDNERISFLKAVFRTKSMDVMLVIDEGQNVKNIAKYWGAIWRTSDIEPLLEDLSNHPGGGKINIGVESVLRNYWQKFIYSGIEEYETDWKDCHWTTINFFNKKVDERYYNFPDLFSFIKDISDPIDLKQLWIIQGKAMK